MRLARSLEGLSLKLANTLRSIFNSVVRIVGGCSLRDVRAVGWIWANKFQLRY